MDSGKSHEFKIVTDSNADYAGDDMNIRESMPSRKHLWTELSTHQSKYPVYGSFDKAVENASTVLNQEKNIIAVAIHMDGDNFKLYFKPSHKFEHFNIACRRIGEGKKHKNDITLMRKIPVTIKTHDEMVDNVLNKVATIMDGYITASLIIGMLFGGSVIFGIIALTAYYGYVKGLVIKFYPQIVSKIYQNLNKYGFIQNNTPSHNSN